MATIQEKQQILIEEFEFFDEWMDKYNHIIEMGKSLPMPVSYTHLTLPTKA